MLTTIKRERKLNRQGEERMIDITILRKLNIDQNIAITKHAKERLIERNINLNDILSGINSGEIIKQYENDKPLPSCLILGKDCNNKPIHIVVSHDNDFIYLITSYHPNPAIWKSDFKSKL